ncbi:cupin domain-containing protein [Cellulomonas sp. McL0617]|uniref:cupin domain-containing protein n=1 Tax=Cellulomonas sp. McL0617 TaxID=3415675 RepID=UPI003CED6E23
MTDTPIDGDPVTRVLEHDITFGAPKAVGRVQMRRITMAPGVASGLHVHNGPVFGTVLRGSVLFGAAGEPVRVLTAGDVFFEAEGAPIAHFDAQDEGVEFVGVFPLAGDQEPGIGFPE